MSVIYTSADTAETVNRAVKNVQGTTTTTDGAAADGMIINENLKPIIQNVTTYTNPTVVKTDTGEPPLTFHSVQAVIDWSIWGNTSTGNYVGEVSMQLWDGNYKSNWGVNVASKSVFLTDDRYAIIIPVENNTDYTISRSAVGDSTYFVYGLSIDIPDDNTVFEYCERFDNTALSQTVNSRECSYLVVFYGAAISPHTMVNSGTTPKPYEPYGVNIPIKFNGTTYNTYISDYLRKSDGDTSVYDVMMSDGTIIRAVNSDGTAKETPTTETYTAPELFTIWGWNVFDVDTTVSPSNVSVTYKDI